jgi:hypothetical protein
MSQNRLDVNNIAVQGNVEVTGIFMVNGLNTGSLPQAVQTTKTDTFTTVSTTFVPITGLTATITPRDANSRILVSFSINISKTNLGNSSKTNLGVAHVRLVNNLGTSWVGDASGSRTRSTMSFYYETVDMYWSSCHTFTVIDSPATAAAVTYTVQALTTDAGKATYINRAETDANNAATNRSPSSISLLEILG